MAQKKRNYNQEKRAAKRAAKAIKKTNHPILIVIALILVEIGRASCRERVY